jgi:hypothetical protein
MVGNHLQHQAIVASKSLSHRLAMSFPQTRRVEPSISVRRKVSVISLKVGDTGLAQGGKGHW